MEIIKATIENANIITETKIKAYNDETNRFGPGRDGGPDGYNDINETIRLINTYDYYIIIADDIIIGSFWTHKLDNQTVELEDFCILPEYHNKGYGYKSLCNMLKLYPDVKKWRLGTPYYSVKNHYLYEKAGFKRIGKSEDDFLVLFEILLDLNIKTRE